ncbi:MAG: hypothetical protein WCF65_03335 [Parachlamydiaceae bacterium]
MNYILKFLCLCLCLATISCLRPADCSGLFQTYGPIHIQLADKEADAFASEMKREGFMLVEYGGAMMTNVQSFSMIFMSSQQVDLEKSRRIFVRMSERFLLRINASDALRPYLANYPMTARNLDLGILFSASLVSPFDKYVNNVGMLNTLSETRVPEIFYDRFHPDTKKIDSIHRETYQEALEIVAHQNQPSTSPVGCE